MYYIKFEYLKNVTYPSETAQFLEAKRSETVENSERPIMVTAGAMVRGVTNLRTRPTIPR